MSKRKSNLILCIGMYFLSILFLAMTSRLHYPSNVWPYLICCSMLVFTTVILFTQVITVKGKADANSVEEEKETSYSSGRVIFMAVASVIYAVLMDVVGFYATSFVFMMLLFNMAQDRFGWRPFVKTIGLSLAVLLVIYVTFSSLLSVPTPTGLII